MATDGKLLARARDTLARRREAHEAERDAREARLWQENPALRDTDAALRALMGEVVSLAVSHAGPEAFADLERRSAELCERHRELLAAAGYPENYLDGDIDCPDCRDSGYLPSGEMCHCLRALYESERAKELAAALALGEESFADFSLDYYTGADREQMELVLNACRSYAVKFGPDSPNLLFRGGTGLGKTFLSGCIAKTVSGRGFAVVYETALDAFDAFESQKFSRDAENYAEASERVKRILDCDLLILDDLGTELTTSFTQSALYNIVNSRLTAGRKTIISTNLSGEETARRYLPQTVSRLGGEYVVLDFVGRDVRRQRLEHKYR